MDSAPVTATVVLSATMVTYPNSYSSTIAGAMEQPEYCVLTPMRIRLGNLFNGTIAEATPTAACTATR